MYAEALIPDDALTIFCGGVINPESASCFLGAPRYLTSEEKFEICKYIPENYMGKDVNNCVQNLEMLTKKLMIPSNNLNTLERSKILSLCSFAYSRIPESKS